MSQSDDMAAINNTIVNTPTKTNKAFDLQTQWKAWYEGLGWWDRTADDDTLAIARRKRDDFYEANGKQVPSPIRTGTPAAVVAKRLNVDPNPVVRAPTAPATKRPTLRRGSTGQAVKEWQKRMGLDSDGNFGSGTVAATKAFQTAHGLDSDGVVGPGTWMAAYTTDKSPAPIPSVIHDAAGNLPSASGKEVKQNLIKHVVETAKKISAEGKDHVSADLVAIHSAGISTPVKVGAGVAGAGLLWWLFKGNK